MTKKLPNNLTFLFPSNEKGCSEILYETAKVIDQEINSAYTPEIDRETVDQSVDILYQTPKGYLLVNIQQDGQAFTYQGSNTDHTTTIEGAGRITSHVAFLGVWLDKTLTE